MSLRVSRWTLVRADGSTGTLWLSRATGFFDRLRGLIARPLPEPGQGLWLEPCNAVHSLAMRAPIDLVFLDRSRRVLAIEAGLAPWRAAACRRAFSTIELRAGEACRLSGRRYIGCEIDPDTTERARSRLASLLPFDGGGAS